MEIADLNDDALLAEGGQSKIYRYDSTRILRVPKRERDFDRIRYEYGVYQWIQDTILVPRVDDLATYKGAPCLIMERIVGCDLFSGIAKRPLTIFGIPKKLARMHTELFQIPAGEVFETNHGKARYCIGNSKLLSPKVREQLLDLLASLAGGTTLCHGDFHPGNIIEAGGKSYIIDWSSATSGSPLFDVAHTYLLLINTPRLDGVSERRHRLQRRVTRYIGRRYLRLVCRQNSFNVHDLLPYLLIKAGERTFYGMESEKQWLADFIKNTFGKKRIDMFHLENYA